MLIEVILSPPAAMLVGAKLGHELARGLAHVNQELVSSSKVPGLYQSGVRWIADKPGRETFIDALHVIQRRGADCSSLAAYRVGELWAAGETGADIAIHYKGFRDGYRLYHVKVRRADGGIEDPSRLLGMPI